MHTLEITGETPEALYFNVVKTLSLFLRGPQVADSTPPAVAEPDAHPQAAGETPVVEVIAPKTRRNAKVKPAETELPKDDISDVAAGKTIQHDPQTLTLDGDIRPRLRAIQKACTERGLDMPATIQYIQKLYGPFGIAKAEQLKPEQFAEFMEASDGYLSGDA